MHERDGPSSVKYLVRGKREEGGGVREFEGRGRRRPRVRGKTCRRASLSLSVQLSMSLRRAAMCCMTHAKVHQYFSTKAKARQFFTATGYGYTAGLSE